VVSVVIGGGLKTLEKAYQAIMTRNAVLAFAGSGGAADFISETYNIRDKPLVHIVTNNNS